MEHFIFIIDIKETLYKKLFLSILFAQWALIFNKRLTGSDYVFQTETSLDLKPNSRKKNICKRKVKVVSNWPT